MKKFIKENPEISSLVVIGLISLGAAFFLTSSKEQLLESLRGVAYEGVILASLVGIFILISEKKSEKRKLEDRKNAKLRSRDSLIKILSLLCEAYHTGGVFHWTKHVKNAASFEVNFLAFQKAKQKEKAKLVAQLQHKEFKNSCEHNLPTMFAHIPIAEKLSPAHLDAWIGLCSLVSLTVQEGLAPEIILNEFEDFMLEFSKAQVLAEE